MGADRYRAIRVDFAGWILWTSEAVKTLILNGPFGGVSI
ncbi:MAG: hypothetical protein QOD93_6576 [Acetobacteraceae bacterium]|jgi:hypothetical protein|nr:hypothetical protein [Rhodopila sp.]MEA2773614.1 hypothetical protein [Acetobacteraceae bacterium]